MENKKMLGLIGLAARARKISFGADSVELQIKKRKVFLIIIAEDASNRTKDKFQKLADEYQVSVLNFETIDVLSKAIGKSNKAVIGVEECHIANEIQKIKNGGEVIG